MSFQLEVVKFRDLLAVTSIPRFVPGLSQLTLEVTGDDFSSANEVFVNEVKAPEIIIVNKNTMWVVLPESARERIDSIEVLSSNFTKTTQSQLRFRLGNKTKTVSGILKLTQLFVKWLLQSPGSDIFNPQRGGGLQELAGRVSTMKSLDPIMATVVRSVNTTASQIQKAQTGRPDLPMSERLLAADILDLGVSDKTLEARVHIGLRAMSGEGARASIEL